MRRRPAAAFDAARAAYEAGSLPYDAFARLAEELYTALADGRAAAELETLAAGLVGSDPLRPGGGRPGRGAAGRGCPTAPGLWGAD
ncbi:MAG: hypothetical protein V9G19_14805 [Tetrasphaera sp.]